MLVQQFTWMLAHLAALALVGGFVVVPFGRVLRFPALVSPAVGILCLGLATATVYTILGVGLGPSVLIAAGSCACLTIVTLSIHRPAFRSKDLLFSMVMFSVAALICVRAADATTLRLGTPAILYIDGTDHLGYAHVADWLVAHRVAAAPVYSPDRPYEAYPSLLFHSDPRFGSFFFLAACAWVRRLPAVFVYDFVSSVALAAMVVGVAATFARSRLTLVFLIFALFVGQWYDLGQSGFFGKLLAYPATLILIGLFIQMPTVPTAGMLCALGIVAAGAAIMHSGLATSLIFVCVAIVYLTASAAAGLNCGRKWTADRAMLAAAITAIMILATGVVARPVQYAFPEILQFDWKFVFVRCLDLKSQWAAQLSNNVIPTIVAVILWVALIGLAIRLRNVVALVLLAAPVLILAVVAAAWGRGGSLQLVGVIYPLTACEAACLSSPSTQDPSRSRHAISVQRAVAALCVALVAMRVPRFSESLHRYAGKHASRKAQFSLAESESLSRAVGTAAVNVDLVNPREVIFVLVELGRRDIRVQWSPRAWNVAVGYTGWPPPRYASSCNFNLVAAQATDAPNLPLVLQTPHFKLQKTSP